MGRQSTHFGQVIFEGPLRLHRKSRRRKKNMLRVEHKVQYPICESASLWMFFL